MAIKVTISAVLPDWLDADKVWETGGMEAIRELVYEDDTAFLTEPTAVWTIEKVTEPNT
jgi:hypothetical protein